MTIGMREGLAAGVPDRSAVVGLRATAGGLRLGFPISLRSVVGLLNPIRLSFRFTAGTCSGSCEITLRMDGLVHYRGNVHNSGALAATYVAITSFPAGTIGPVVIAHRGHVGGTFSFDTRGSSWDQTTTDSRIAANWSAVEAGAAMARTDFGVAAGALDLVDGLVNLATGVFVFGL